MQGASNMLPILSFCEVSLSCGHILPIREKFRLGITHNASTVELHIASRGTSFHRGSATLHPIRPWTTAAQYEFTFRTDSS